MRRLRMIAMVAATALVASGCVYLGQVSVDANGVAYSVDIEVSDVSGDGRYVLLSSSGQLTASDTNTAPDIYRKDTVTGAIELVTVGTGGLAAGALRGAAVSDDGRFVAFASLFSTLIVGDTNGAADVFVRDLVNQTTIRASLDDTGSEVSDGSFDPSISGDGAVVAWRSAGAFVDGQSNGFQQIYIRGVASGPPSILSASGAGALGDESSWNPSTDFDGSATAFSSAASNLVAGDTNLVDDVFVGFSAGGIARASTAQGGAEANAVSFDPSISGNGLFVAFQSPASNLVSGDTNLLSDIFVKSIFGPVVRASLTSSEGELTGSSISARMNGDGSAVVFATVAPELTDGSGQWIANVRDLSAGVTTSASVSSTGGLVALGNTPRVAISADGNYVAFSADETTGPVVPGDTNGTEDVFLRWWSEPVVTSISPPSLPRGVATPVTITGSGFRPVITEVSTNIAVPGSDGIFFTNVVVVDATTITADIEVVLGSATAGLKWVNVEQVGSLPATDTGSLGNCRCLTITP